MSRKKATVFTMLRFSLWVDAVELLITVWINVDQCIVLPL